MAEEMHYVFLAGIGNSEPEHWQSIWFRSMEKSASWVDHRDWDNPDAAEWVDDLEAVMAKIRGPKVFVAHSLGCLLAVERAKRHRDPDVRGSFLVSVPDVNGRNFPRQAVGFGAAVDGRPPMPAMVVASTNDAYSSVAHAQSVAAAWAVALTDVGALGHINLASGIGAWPAGRQLFDRFVASLSSSP
jgi:predicted alpha/beta hydrolase family esterase